MHRRSFFFTALCLMISVLPAAAQWDFHLINGWSSANGSDIVYKSNGYPVAAYTVNNSSGTDYVYLAEWDGDSWNVSLVYSASPGVGNLILGSPRVMITMDDVPFIAFHYYYAGTTNRLYLFRRTTQVTYWGAQSSFDMIMDPASTSTNYNIHLLFLSGSDLYYTKYPTPNTGVLIEPSASPGKIRLDSGSHLHIVYTSSTGPSFLKYGYSIDDASWSTWTIQPLIQSSSYSLVVDDTSVPILYAQTGTSPNYTIKQITIQR